VPRTTIDLSATPSTACNAAAAATPAVAPASPIRAHAAARPFSIVSASATRATARRTIPRNCPRWVPIHRESPAYSANAAAGSFGSALDGCSAVAMKSVNEPATAAAAPMRARCRRVLTVS
jgi:hypothetical protein